MKKLILLLLCWAGLANAAITDHYVSSSASGGTSWATCVSAGTPCTLSTAMTNAAAGDRVNIKNDGTYTRAASDTVTNTATVTSPIIWRGYNTTIGDGFQGRTNGNGALITTNMPTISYNSTFVLTGTAFNIWESLQITGTANNTLVTFGGDNLVKSCKVTNSNTGSSTATLTLGNNARTTLFDCDVEITSASGTPIAAVISNSPGQRIIANRIKGGLAQGVRIQVANNTTVIVGNTIFASTGIGIAVIPVTGSPLIYGNTIVGGGADAINIITANTVLQFIANNMITDNTGDAIDMVSSSNPAVLAYNRTRGNGTALANGGDWTTATNYATVTTGSGTASDYTNYAGNDFSLVSTSAAVEAGWPSYASIGALEPHATSGGGQRSLVYGQ